MVEYLHKVGDVVKIWNPQFMRGKTGYIKELHESMMMTYGEYNMVPSYRVHLFESGETIVFIEDSIEAIV
jgi:hypothetical protein